LATKILYVFFEKIQVWPWLRGLLCSLLQVAEEILPGAVITSFPGWRKEAARQFMVLAVIGQAFATLALARTGLIGAVAY
jgi:hypothetical protein